MRRPFTITDQARMCLRTADCPLAWPSCAPITWSPPGSSSTVPGEVTSLGTPLTMIRAPGGVVVTSTGWLAALPRIVAQPGEPRIVEPTRSAQRAERAERVVFTR